MIPFYAQNSTLSFCRKKYLTILKQKQEYIKPIFHLHFLLLTSQSYETSPSIVSFLPTFGGTVDIIRKQKANNEAGTLRLNTQAIRLHFAVNFANFKGERRGNLIDFGVGYSFSTRELFVKQ